MVAEGIRTLKNPLSDFSRGSIETLKELVGEFFYIVVQDLTAHDKAVSYGDRSMNGVITALIIALAFILTFFWAPIVGVITGGSLDLAQPLRMSDNSVNAGYVTGYAADQDTISDTQVSVSHPDAQKMGAVSFRISLNSYRAFFQNDMSIDIDSITVNFVSPSGSETLVQKTGRPFIKPGWTVTNKRGILPIEYSDEDNILEPYESFEILLYPSTPLPPLSQFLILVQLPDNNKIFLPRTVPGTIYSIMFLN